MAAPTKDTIYIDIDDEITTIIDKLIASKSKVVALVLPKRATVLQSVVNMKLLKRAADDNKKSMVLITTEAGLLPLAGASGVYVASSLTSKPEVPTAPDNDESEEMVDEDDSESDNRATEITAATAGAVAVGALAGLPPKDDDVETLQLDDDSVDTDDVDEASAATKAPLPPAKARKDKKLHVPNFERFRLLLIIGVCALILLVVGFVVANNVLPKATITIKTNAQNYNSSSNLVLSTTATSVDLATSTIPAKVVTQTKTYTQETNATGQKNTGTKATGTITVTNCGPTNATVVAGTGFSSGGHTYISQTTIVVPASNFTFGGKCKFDGTASTPVTAQTGGTGFNQAAATYTIAGGSSYLTAEGSAMSGGTDNIVQVVSQSDIDNAKAKISTNDQAVKQTLTTQLTQAGYYPIPATFQAGEPKVTTSANAGDPAASVTVTEVIVYTMFGAHEADMKLVIANSLKSQIDIKEQTILDYGLRGATYSLQSATDKQAEVSMQTVVTVGPKLDEEQIKTEVAGMKSGAAIAKINQSPGVTSVTVKLSPFWVSSIPSKTSKITVVIEKPTAVANSSNNDVNP